jgi:hypothetical protein
MTHDSMVSLVLAIATFVGGGYAMASAFWWDQ